MNEQQFAELSAGYALNALSPADRSAFEAALAAHPEWSVHVDADALAASTLAETVAEVAPPLTMRSALLSRITTTPQGPDAASPTLSQSSNELEPAVDDPFDEPEPQPPAPTDPAPTTTMIQAVARRNWTRSLLGLAASLVILVTLGFGAASVWQTVNRSPATVALEQIEDSPDAQVADVELDGGGTAAAHWSETLGKAVLVSEGLPALTDDETFEMWFVRTDGSVQSGGTFASASDGPTTSVLAGTLQPGDTIAVTVEPAGGAPDGTPTSDPIVAIPTA